MSEAQRESERRVGHPRCPFCHEDVTPGDPLEVCRTCHAFHHDECWRELAGCSACGAERPPASLEPRARAGSRRSLAVERGVVVLALVVAAIMAFAFATRGDLGAAVPRRAPANAASAAEPDPRSPTGIVEQYLRVLASGNATERDLTPLLTPESAPVLALETDSWRSFVGVAAGAFDLVDQAREDWATLDEALVHAAHRRFALVRREGVWRIDRRLEPEPVRVAGLALRLPAGMVDSEREGIWRCGALTLTVTSHVRRPGQARVAFAPPPDADPATRHALPVGGGLAATAFQSTFARPATSFVVVEASPEEDVVFALGVENAQAPLTRGTLESVLRASLETLAVVPPSSRRTADAAGLERRSVGDAGSILAPRVNQSGGETVELVELPGADIGVAVGRALEGPGQFQGELWLPEAALPWRGVFVVLEERSAPRLHGSDRTREHVVVKAVGIVGGVARELVLTSRDDSPQTPLALRVARLMAMADSFEPAHPTR